RHAGDTVRITAQLIRAADGSTLWSEHYDRPFRDLFALQDEITREVASEIADIVDAKQFWIYRSPAEWRDLNATRVLREFRDGEGFLYLGRAYRLRLVSGQEQPLSLRDGRFLLRRELAESGDPEAARTAFRNYYVKRGRERIGKRVAYFAPKAGVSPISTDVRELGNRWASCSREGHLAFHWKCLMAPLSIIDYIVVHELCHLHCQDHTDAFWNEVDKVLPEYRQRKEWLRIHGASLDL
ncbi:MAG TPA: YgjP-like metallopeptidase domain-containing protein, partial [Luteimonas sp.]